MFLFCSLCQWTILASLFQRISFLTMIFFSKLSEFGTKTEPSKFKYRSYLVHCQCQLPWDFVTSKYSYFMWLVNGIALLKFPSITEGAIEKAYKFHTTGDVFKTLNFLSNWTHKLKCFSLLSLPGECNTLAYRAHSCVRKWRVLNMRGILKTLKRALFLKTKSFCILIIVNS